MLSIDTSWTDPADNEAALAWTRDFWDEMQRDCASSVYLNFASDGDGTEAVMRDSYGDANYERLVAIKTKYDPTNLFSLNQNIPPKGA